MHQSVNEGRVPYQKPVSALPQPGNWPHQLGGVLSFRERPALQAMPALPSPTGMSTPGSPGLILTYSPQLSLGTASTSSL